MPAEIIQNQEREYKPQGLKDGGHVIIKCSSCHKPLVDVWRTRPDLKDPRTGKPFEWKIVAACCYCNDKSYITTVLGGFHIGGYGVDVCDPNDKRDVIDSVEKTTIVDTTTLENRPDVTYIKTARFKQG
jgi:hypothetical protein